MNVYYFGADKPWEELLEFGFRRRNTCILKALVESPHTGKVYVVRKVTRQQFLKQLFKKKKDTGKVQDLAFASLFPEKWSGKNGSGKWSRRPERFRSAHAFHWSKTHGPPVGQLAKRLLCRKELGTPGNGCIRRRSQYHR